MSTVHLQMGRDNKVLNIATIQIRPNRTQPRRNFDEKELKSLSRSIVENGILQPLVVRRINSTEFELIAGERRLRAAVMAGLNKVPCVIHKCNDKDSALLALIENLQRTDLNMFEEARGIARLIRKYGLTQEQAAIKLGKKQSTIANKLRLLRLGFEEQEWIMTAHLSERHARTLLRINNEALRREVLSRIIAEGLSVTQAEELVNQVLMKKPEEEPAHKPERKMAIKDVRIFVNTINKAVDTMRLSGINAISRRNETDDYIEYTVKIPKAVS
ncbi:ParB/RepB/Spo0J family partition protein [uncultured Ruminococcus sp.]|uniref:ParB/RepB/Spo0J family partition protein n=1 Tax=uncultured Ruminococcus sp. TaxID=165186 RepID=UPI00292E5058|nr:ParB/RepB/Spo0J family partition protein [uncultured Ruminococcus sp.]